MMGTSGNGDTNAVFSLLAALSDPASAKAKLQDITAATESYQKMIDDFSISSKKTLEEVAAAKADLQDQQAAFNSLKSKVDADNLTVSKRLSDKEDSLNKLQLEVSTLEEHCKTLAPVLDSRETTVNQRELAVVVREKVAQDLMDSATKLRDSYEARHTALEKAMSL